MAPSFYLLIENLTYSTYDEVYEMINIENFHYLTMTWNYVANTESFLKHDKDDDEYLFEELKVSRDISEVLNRNKVLRSWVI